MLMLIPKVDLEGNVNSNLNTSHVNVNQVVSSYNKIFLRRFKYISC